MQVPPYPRKLILKCPLPPGDIVVLSAAVRDLHRSYPNRFLVDVRTAHPEVWNNNPYITPLNDWDPEVCHVECHYPLISQSNQLPKHFIEGFIDHFNRRLNLGISVTEFRGDIHLSEDEEGVAPAALASVPTDVPIWLIAAGGKRDFTIKWWDSRRYQEVVDHFGDRIRFVQVGAPGDFHPELNGVIDLRGRTNLRDLIRLIHHSDGVLCGVTSLMHLAAAVPVRGGRSLRPCVVIAGGREPAHWEAYPGHQFLHTIGVLRCCASGGCWRARTKPLQDGSQFNDQQFLCEDVDGNLPRCMSMITATDVIRATERFLLGASRFAMQTPARISFLDSHPKASAVSTENGIFQPLAHFVSEGPKPVPQDLLIRHYSRLARLRKQPLGEDLSAKALTNTPQGLGDTIILTHIPGAAARQGKKRFIHSESIHFKPLVFGNPHYEPAETRTRIASDFLNARYDLGNGHFIQRLQRAFGLAPDIEPKGDLTMVSSPIRGMVAMHFEAGVHAQWQRKRIHSKARELYPDSKLILEEFVRNHPGWRFMQLGEKPIPIEGVENTGPMPLELSLRLLAQCDLFIGIVSGPMHAATALGVRCIVLINFPRAAEVMLPTLKNISLVESEWLYPQNVHLHQEDSAPLVPKFSLRNLERAVDGDIYPFWSREFLPLINEIVPEPS